VGCGRRRRRRIVPLKSTLFFLKKNMKWCRFD